MAFYIAVIESMEEAAGTGRLEVVKQLHQQLLPDKSETGALLIANMFTCARQSAGMTLLRHHRALQMSSGMHPQLGQLHLEDTCTFYSGSGARPPRWRSCGQTGTTTH